MARGKSSGASLALWLALATLVVVLDQFTKWLILGHYQLGDATPVTGFFNLVPVAAAGSAGFSSPWRWLRPASSSGCCASMRGSGCFPFRWR